MTLEVPEGPRLFAGSTAGDPDGAEMDFKRLVRTVQELRDWLAKNNGRLETVTTNPDGVREGAKGEQLLLQTGGSSYLEINTDGDKEWRGVLLTDTP